MKKKKLLDICALIITLVGVSTFAMLTISSYMLAVYFKDVDMLATMTTNFIITTVFFILVYLLYRVLDFAIYYSSRKIKEAYADENE